MTILAAIASFIGAAFSILLCKRREKNGRQMQLAKYVSHVRVGVTCTDMEASETFYMALGLVRLHDNLTSRHGHEKYRLLKSPVSRIIQQPYILLEDRTQEPSAEQNATINPSATHAAEHVGIARMCFIVGDVNALLLNLKEIHGICPVAPPIEGSLPETNDEVDVAAFRDPSGNLVELLSFKRQNPLVSLLASMFRFQPFPLFFHVNVNVSSYDTSLEAYQKLGYTVSHDFGRFGDGNLNKAIAVPDPGIAAHVSLIKLPRDRLFVIELMEWEDPHTTITTVAGAPSVSIAIVVDDVAEVIDKVISTNVNDSKSSGNGEAGEKTKTWRLLRGPMRLLLPPPLGAMTAASVLDPNGMPLELVSYT